MRDRELGPSVRGAALCAALFCGAAAIAYAQETPGAPGSAERRTYCEGQKSTCMRGYRTTCGGVPLHLRNQCVEDVRNACNKDFFYCFDAPPDSDAPAAEASVSGPRASAMGSCDALLAVLRNAPFVDVLWTTNYFARGERFIGVTAIELRRRGEDLAGDGNRSKMTLSGTGGARPIGEIERRTLGRGEHVSVRISADGKIMFQGIYGPYETVCWGDRFAAVHTGDSLETFNFKVPSR